MSGKALARVMGSLGLAQTQTLTPWASRASRCESRFCHLTCCATLGVYQPKSWDISCEMSFTPTSDGCHEDGIKAYRCGAWHTLVLREW